MWKGDAAGDEGAEECFQIMGFVGVFVAERLISGPVLLITQPKLANIHLIG